MRSIPCIRSTFLKISYFCTPKYNCTLSSFRCNGTLTSFNTIKVKICTDETSKACYIKNNHIINSLRAYSKKKKSKKAALEEEESDNDEDESFETMEDDVIEDNYNITSRTIPSMRIDTVIKAALGVTKKKVEKEFYANNLRLNGALVSKKSINIGEGDEVDTVKGLSPDNDCFLLVDRVTVKSVGKVTGTGNYPVKFQVFKGLTIENYNDPWIKSSPNDPD